MAGISKRERKNRKIGEGVSKMTPEKIAKLEEAFAIDATIEEACFYADIDPSTYNRWIHKNPKLHKRFTALRNKPVLKARQTVVKGLDDTHNAQWYLTRKKKKEFGDNVDVTSGGKEIPLFDYVRNKTLRINNGNGKDTAVTE